MIREGVQAMSSLEEIQALIHKKYGIEPSALDPNASMRGHGIDSLTLVEFLFAVEDHYGISVPDKYSEVDTLAELAAAVDEIRAA
jgi:acyl carrier protein